MKVPPTVFNAILRHLTPNQVDSLRLYNRELRQQIERTPRENNGTPVIAACVESNPAKSYVMTFNEQSEVEQHDVVDNNYMVHLHHTRPRWLFLEGNIPYQYFDVRWLRSIKKVYITSVVDYMTVDDFYKCLQILNTPCLKVHDKKLVLDVNKVMETMPYLEELDLMLESFQQDFYENLVQKSKRGYGMALLCIFNMTGQPFDAKQLIYILEKAKFKKREVENPDSHKFNRWYIFQVSGTFEDFEKALMEVVRREHWNLKRVQRSPSRFKIDMGTSCLIVEITKFCEEE